MLDRHPTDFIELFFGIAFLATGAGFIVHQTANQTFDVAWVAAIALVTIGCAFLAATVLHRPRDNAAGAVAEPVAESAAESADESAE